ncbi:MAG: DNA-processing protein DprA [Dehalococcoidales bacterium]|nr:DNA-processing protein DprA [Dehalococcoidales bacterium]
MNGDTKYWVAFNNIPGIGRVRLGQLERYFGSLREAWQAPLSEMHKAGLDSAAVRTITKWRGTISPESEMDRIKKAGVQVMTCNEPGYPSRLKEIYDYPPVLYIRGEILPQDEWCLAVVGTRRASVYGKQVTGELTAELAASGITIVSGLARGIDTIAHRSALESGGRTIAVFACGLDMVYPAENERLARDITEHGACVSEFPLGMRPRAENFPRRNRILSGLSLGVLVTEADEGSGAMITARFALEQNREVFAIPGSILSPVSRGTNHLIQDGAKLVSGHMDILEELNLTSVTRQMEMREILPDSGAEALLLRELGPEPTHIDVVCRKSGLPVAEVSGTLAMMEIKGMIKQVGAMNYVLARELRQDYNVKVE